MADPSFTLGIEEEYLLVDRDRCVVVRRGRVISEGYHRRFGGPHAEIEALQADERIEALEAELEPLLDRLKRLIEETR